MFKETDYNKKSQNKLIALLILCCILSSGIFAFAIMKSISSEIKDENIFVPLLLGSSSDYFDIRERETTLLLHAGSEESNKEQEMTNGTSLPPVFSTGQQLGEGGSGYSVYDSFNWTGMEICNTTNAYVSNKPTTPSYTISLQNSTGYDREYGIFNISNVESEYNKSAIEDDTKTTLFSSQDSGGSYYEISMSFEIPVDYVHLKRVKTYTAGSSSATGTIFITHDDGGGKPDESSVISSKEALSLVGIGWHEYTFDNEILLQKGNTYHVVMNTTHTDTVNEYWWWYYTLDGGVGDGDNEGNVYYRQGEHWGGTWYPAGSDLPFEIETIPVEWNTTHYVPKRYTNPKEIDFTYNSSIGSSKLNNFDNFLMNDSIWHKFITNTSISFDLNFVANYTYSLQPILPSIAYKVNNSTITNWNITYSVADINQTYNIKNRHIRITGLGTDWNATAIYWNDTSTAEYTSMTNNDNITLDSDSSNKYTNGSTTMYVNASTLAENTTWYMWFEAPNYLYDFTIAKGMVDLSPLYNVYTMDTVNFSFEVGTMGNLTYWIDYPNGTQAHREPDINNAALTFFDYWVVDNWLDQTTTINGTYPLQAFFITSDKTKVGTIYKSINIHINTSLSATGPPDDEVIIDELYNVTALYKSIHNGSDIQDAVIWCNNSWDETNITMTQLTSTDYNASIPTTGQTPGSFGTIVITTQFPWFETQTEILTVKFVEDSTLNLNESSIALEWYENITLHIWYNDTSNIAIEDADVRVNGSTATFDSINKYYTFELNSTDFPGVGTISNMFINATHSDYSYQEYSFSFEIETGITDIVGKVGSTTYDNLTGNFQRIYAVSSIDSFFLNLNYYHVLTDTTLDTSAPTVDNNNLELFKGSQNPEINDTWTIDFDPQTTGNFLVNISFSLTNYNSSTFIFNVTILEAPTNIFTEISETPDVYYNEFYEFFLLFNNSQYDENITGVTPTINDSTKCRFDGENNNYYNFTFAFNTLDLGSHAINISFTLPDHQSDWRIISFNIIKRPTDIESRDGILSTLLLNNTETLTENYSPTGFDSITFNISYFDDRTDAVLDMSANPEIIVDGTVWVTFWKDVSSNNWTFVFNGTELGSFDITIIFFLDNYENATYLITYVIQEANTAFSDSSVSQSPISTDIVSANILEFYIDWESEYGEAINDSLVSFVSSDLVQINYTNGRHHFRYTAPHIGVYDIILTFETAYYNLLQFTVRFNVTARTMNFITISDANNSVVNVLQWGENYTFYYIIEDSLTTTPLLISSYDLSDTNITFDDNTGGNHTFIYQANSVGSFNNLVIQFEMRDYINQTYIISFVVDKREIKIESTLHPNATTIDTLQWSESYTFYLLLVDFRNNSALIINDFELTGTNISLDDNTDGNHTFTYHANSIGSFTDLLIQFKIDHYTTLNYTISFEVDKRMMVIGDSTYPNGGESVNVRYTESFSFYITFTDSRTTNFIDATSYEIPMNFTLDDIDTGNHSLTYNAIQYKSFTNLHLNFSIDNYYTFIYNISITVFSRTMIIDNAFTHPDSDQPTNDMLYGDKFYFNVYIIDNDTSEPQNISFPYDLGNNIYFIDVENGNHSFFFNASSIGTTGDIILTFSLEFYQNLNYIISFDVDYRSIEFVNALTNPDSNQLATEMLYGDIFYFNVYIVDENTSEPLNVTFSYNVGNSIYFIGVENGNHSFFYNATSVGQTGDLIITFTIGFYYDLQYIISFDVNNRIMDLDIALSTEDTEVPITFLTYGDQYYFNIFLRDLDSRLPLNGIIPNVGTTNISYIDGINGNYSFRYDALNVLLTTGTLTITFTYANYIDYEYKILFTVSEAFTLVDVEPSSTFNLDLDQTEVFSISWSKLINTLNTASLYDQITDAEITYSNENWFTFLGEDSGNYSFIIKAIAVGDSQSFTITLSKYGYNPKDIFIIITVNKIPTSFNMVDYSNDSLVGISSKIYYNSTFEFSVQWINGRNESTIADSNTSIDLNVSGSSITVIMDSQITNGIHSFSFIASELLEFEITIIFSTQNYDDLVYIIKVIISEMPTEKPVFTSISLEVYTGNAVELSGFWKTIDNLTVYDPDEYVITVLINNSPITATKIGDIDSFDLSIPTDGLVQGTYNLSITFEQYGFQTQIVNQTFTLLGRTIKIVVTVTPNPEDGITQGNEIQISVTLSYTTSSSTGFGSAIMDDPSIENISVDCDLYLTFSDGSTDTLPLTERTDALGHTTFSMSKAQTKSLTGFYFIISVPQSDFGMDSQFDSRVDFGEKISLTPPGFTPEQLILIVGIVSSFFLLAAFISIYRVRRRRKKSAQVAIEKGIEQSFEEIKSIRLIFGRHESGLQYYNEKLIQEVETDVDIISGLSSAISSFLEDLSRGMAAESSDEKKTEFETLSREGLQVLIWNGKYGSLALVSERELTNKFFKENLKKAGIDIEERFSEVLSDFYDADAINAKEVKRILRKYLPLYYLSPLVLNEAVLSIDKKRFCKEDLNMLQTIKIDIPKIDSLGGANLLFPEQILTLLSAKFKRSDAIKFIQRAIECNLLIELSQSDLTKIMESLAAEEYSE